MRTNLKDVLIYIAVMFMFCAILAEGFIHQLDIEAAACEQHK